MSPKLAGAVCLVTGASRGIGKGIALQLGKAGATVYITGRSAKDLEATSKEINARGGRGVPVVVDHSNDEDVEALFERIKKEQNGKLDVLVNNAYAAVNAIMENMGKPFWEPKIPESWDVVNNVGLRNHFICTTYAARMMVPRKSGLIVNISSAGGLRYLFNVPYGVGKAACDRMAADCAFELRKHKVAMVALWPGPVSTELVVEKIKENADVSAKEKAAFTDSESVEFSGMAVAHLAADPNVMKKTGRVLMSADLAREYGFSDVDGAIHGDMRTVKFMLLSSGWTTLAGYVPSFVKVPLTLIHLAGYKF